MRKIALAMMLLVLGCSFVFMEYRTTAAETTEMYVNAKNDIILRAEANYYAEKLGTIKNHSKITVLSSSNGWSYVQSGHLKGYVYTIALTSKNPKPTNEPVTDGLTPKEGLILTYSPSFEVDKKESFTVEKDDEYTYLYNSKSPLYPDLSNYTYIENKEKLLVGVSNSDAIFLKVSYPLKQGSYIKFSLMFEERDILVESTTKTIKVKAGTFKNVVIFRFPDRSRIYFAKGIGIIKMTNKNGETVTELVSVKEDK